eukprot:GHVL01017599.1.p2 GENE.GHVL01017599.1~~GHVL01017599.1.p2  ORF type:complete len:134 (+),score=27.64 GHVL01017599.1:293-694(+)
MTIHSFGGIGVGGGPPENLLKMAKKNQKAKARWKDVKLLMIDEVSMMSSELFENLEYVARHMSDFVGRDRSKRGSQFPFGGVQLVLVGDFFQVIKYIYIYILNILFIDTSYPPCLIKTIRVSIVSRVLCGTLS